MYTQVQEDEVPRFSLVERERRWQQVRQLMERNGLDVIVASSTGGFQANARYLTSVGGNNAPVAFVFPCVGEVTVLAGPVPSRSYWLSVQNWITDIRSNFFSEGEALVERLRELPLEQGRIGIVGLADMPRLPEGIVPYGIYMKLHNAFPHAELVNATHLMDEARFVKSAEEIAFLEHSTALVEGAIETLEQVARSGVPEHVVYAQMIASMLAQGGELPSMLLWAAGSPQPPTNAFLPTRRKLQHGDIITCEVEARWGGYAAQVTVTGVIGTVPSDYAEMFRIQQEIVDQAYERFRPGVTIAELLSSGAEATQGTPYQQRMILHSRGLGNDAPIAIFGGQDERINNWRIQENCVFIIKPVVMTNEWLKSLSPHNSLTSANISTTNTNIKTVCWGDTIVATPSGARRLGKHPRRFIEIGQ